MWPLWLSQISPGAVSPVLSPVAHREGKISLFKHHSSRLRVQQKGIIDGQISVHSEQHTEGSSSSCRLGRAKETIITDRQTYKIRNKFRMRGENSVFASKGTPSSES